MGCSASLNAHTPAGGVLEAAAAVVLQAHRLSHESAPMGPRGQENAHGAGGG